MSQGETLFSQHFNSESRGLSYYLKSMEGYSASKKAFGMTQDDIIQEVKKSNLRGTWWSRISNGNEVGLHP